jgi:outer membrane protein TolC
MIERAWKSRSDLKAVEAQVRAAEQTVSAAHAEYLPSVSLNGGYGVIGPNPAHTHGVFAVTGSVNIPVWQGGRTKGDIQQAESALRQRQAELADQRARVEQDVRTALINLRRQAVRFGSRKGIASMQTKRYLKHATALPREWGPRSK